MGVAETRKGMRKGRTKGSERAWQKLVYEAARCMLEKRLPRIERELEKRKKNLERARRRITEGLTSRLRRAKKKRDAFEKAGAWQKLVYKAACRVLEKRLPQVEREREKRTKNLERTRRKIIQALQFRWRRAKKKRDAFEKARA